LLINYGSEEGDGEKKKAKTAESYSACLGPKGGKKSKEKSLSLWLKFILSLYQKGGKEVKKKVFVLIMVLATVLVFGSGTAMAEGDAILFPYWISGGGYATFVQIINLATVNTPVTGTNQGKLHYVYVYNSDTETCQHYDDEGRTTQNDILLYEVTKQFYQGTSNEQLLPGDTTSTSVTLSSSPKWGYLVVEQSLDNFISGLLERTLFGQEYVVNLSTGTIYALNAINDTGETGSGPYRCHFFIHAEVEFHISWLPETYASTMWYFFPVSRYTDLCQTGGIVWDTTLQSGFANGVFDNNESLKSGKKYLMVGCWDTAKMDSQGYPVDEGSGPVTANFFYTLQQILTGEQYAAAANTGGWNEVYIGVPTVADHYTADYYGYIYKLQSTQILGKQMDTILYEPQENGAYLSYTK
jgi:hypothetical protein